jgi:hypothetical protein
MTRESWVWLAQVLGTFALGIILAVLCNAAIHAVARSF